MFSVCGEACWIFEDSEAWTGQLTEIEWSCAQCRNNLLRARTTRRSHPSTCKDLFFLKEKTHDLRLRPAVESFVYGWFSCSQVSQTRKSTIVRRAVGRRWRPKNLLRGRFDLHQHPSMHATFCTVTICSPVLYRPGLSPPRDSAIMMHPWRVSKR